MAGLIHCDSDGDRLRAPDRSVALRAFLFGAEAILETAALRHLVVLLSPALRIFADASVVGNKPTLAALLRLMAPVSRID
jgi:hypothetical protein